MTLGEQGEKAECSPLFADSGNGGCNGMFCQYSRGVRRRERKNRARETDSVGDDNRQPQGANSLSKWITQNTVINALHERRKQKDELTFVAHLRCPISTEEEMPLFGYKMWHRCVTLRVYSHIQEHVEYSHSHIHSTHTTRPNGRVPYCSVPGTIHVLTLQCSTPHSATIPFREACEQPGWGFRAAKHSG